jgi:hypothetical protein
VGIRVRVLGSFRGVQSGIKKPNQEETEEPNTKCKAFCRTDKPPYGVDVTLRTQGRSIDNRRNLILKGKGNVLKSESPACFNAQGN